jgi:conjugal transfer pilus assembly protein TraL
MNAEIPNITIKTLDNYPRILFWNLDDFLIVIVPMFFGICLGMLSLMLVGIVPIFIYRRMKKKMPHGSFKHKLYWILPTRVMRKLLKNVPSSHYREMLL